VFEAEQTVRMNPEKTTAGLLHTVPALAGTFQDLVTRTSPGLDLVHVADPQLLAMAIRDGVTREVYDKVRRHVAYLTDGGAAAVLVTCSSIGEAVEAAAAASDVPVLRVDAAMARQAVALAGAGGAIAVLATLEATLGPTGRLIEREVEAASANATVSTTVVPGAAAARNAGYQEKHDQLIRDALLSVSADVIVLAQASMAHAGVGLDRGVPVLTSPPGGVSALVGALESAS
jgi:Asp/Glu/hydantoin racemase